MERTSSQGRRCKDFPGIYLTVTNLDVCKRARRANNFPLTLDSHKSNFEDVDDALQSLPVLERSSTMLLMKDSGFLPVSSLHADFAVLMPQRERTRSPSPRWEGLGFIAFGRLEDTPSAQI